VGRAALWRRDFATAKAVLQKLVAIDLNYRSGDASLAYARALIGVGEPADAKAHLAADTGRRRDAQGRVLLAAAHADLYEIDEARRLVQEVLLDEKTAVSAHTRRAVREAKQLRRRLDSGVRSQVDLVRQSVGGLSASVARRPLLVFGLVAVCVVGGDFLWQRTRLHQRRTLSMFEEELADSLDFDYETLRIIKDHTGAELEPLMAPTGDGGFTVEGVHADWLALIEEEDALDRIRSALEGRGYQAFRYVPALLEEIRRFCPSFDQMAAESLTALSVMVQYSQPVMLIWK